MKLRVLRRDHIALAITAGLFLAGLIAVSSIWPAAFGIVITIGGAGGALVVIYEVRLTKRLAQAEFIRDLQTGFAGDANICELWRKLLLDEAVTAEDRPLVSSYLTFFETLHLLLSRKALDLSLTDDLFRNRFFTAVGDKGVLDTALIRQAGSFSNIHDLIELWYRHLLQEGIPIHPGYYSYVEALTEAKGYAWARLEADDLQDLLELQERVIDSLGDHDQLRANTDVMLKACLVEHTTLGLRSGGELVAAAILFDGAGGSESLRRHLRHTEADLDTSVNLKVVLVDARHRRMGLGRSLIELLEKEAVKAGKTEILCTIHPKNDASRALFDRLSYQPLGKADTTYGRREIYGRTLPDATRCWAR
jgi:ribosomal protein S18 acetylase RimI-like enzyme